MAFGSSHGYYGFDPEMIGCLDGINLANTNQSLMLDLLLFEKYKTRISQLKVVIFFIDVFSLEMRTNSSAESWRNRLYVKYWDVSEEWTAFLNPSNLFLLSIFGPEKALDIITNRSELDGIEKISLKGWYRSPVVGFNQGYLSYSSIFERVKNHRNLIRNESNRAETLEYLQRVIGNSNEDVKYFFVESPMHPIYRKLFGENLKRLWSDLEYISRDKTNIYILRPSSDIFDEQDFHDADHLNISGAQKLSKYLDQKICHHKKNGD